MAEADRDRMRLRAAALTLHDADGGARDKPDRKADVFADLGSPVSPLRLRPAAATPSSSSSSAGSAKSPAPGNAAVGRVARGSHSGELAPESTNPPRPPGHRRSGSGPLIFSGGSSSAGSVGGGGGRSTASSPLTNALPAGNICPSGRVAGAAAAAASQPPRARPAVLGSGTGHYGHGSIMRGGGATAARTSVDAAPLLHSTNSYSLRSPASCPAPPATSGGLQEITRAGNEWYKKGRHAEALIGFGRLAEAFRECEEAVRLDPASGRAHGRLAGLCLRLGMIEKARTHFTLAGSVNQSDPAEWHKLHDVEIHQGRCMDARKIGDWKSALREADAAIAIGADSSRLLLALRSEALLRLHKLEEADSTIASLLKLDNASLPLTATKVSGMSADSYAHIVQAQVNMAFGRFDSAVELSEKAKLIDRVSSEVEVVLNNVRLVAMARAQGNDLFKAGSLLKRL